MQQFPQLIFLAASLPVKKKFVVGPIPNLNTGCLAKTSQGTAFTFHALGLSREPRDRLEHIWSKGKGLKDVTFPYYKASVGDRHGQPGWASSLKPGYSSCVLEEQNKTQITPVFLQYFICFSFSGKSVSLDEQSDRKNRATDPPPQHSQVARTVETCTRNR